MNNGGVRREERRLIGILTTKTRNGHYSVIPLANYTIITICITAYQASLALDSNKHLYYDGEKQRRNMMERNITMAFDLNRIQIIGRLGRDPEMRYTPQGTAITNFTVAVGGKWTDRDGNERGDETEWFRVDVWGPRDGGDNAGLAGQCNQYLSKGQQVYVEGRFKTEKWIDRDGLQRTSNKIVASNVVFLGSRSERVSDDMGDDYESAPSSSPPPVEHHPAPPAPRSTSTQPSSRRNQPRPVERPPLDDEEIPF